MMDLKLKKTIFHLLITIFLFSIGCTKEKECDDCQREDITIGALLSLSGSGSSAGESTEKALEIALNDINQYLGDISAGNSVSLVIEDTQTDPIMALEKMTSLRNQGTRIIIGPYSSASVKAVKDYADQNDLLSISCSSVAPSVAIPGDNIFRLVPADNNQAEAITSLLADDNIQALVPIIRDDLWGNELLDVTTIEFEEHGGVVFDPIKYHTDTEDFEAFVAQLSSNLDQALTQFPAERTGIYLVSFSEGTKVLHAATAISELSSINWYGSSAFAESKSLINNAGAADFAIAQNFSCPVFGLDDNAKELWEPVSNQIEDAIGRKPEVYALVAYDVVWITALTYLMLGNSPQLDQFKDTFRETASNYYGVTGWTALNDADDRAYATYDFFGIKKEGNDYSWIRTARYNNATGELIKY